MNTDSGHASRHLRHSRGESHLSLSTVICTISVHQLFARAGTALLSTIVIASLGHTARQTPQP
jgi:hypothetical protein